MELNYDVWYEIMIQSDIQEIVILERTCKLFESLIPWNSLTMRDYLEPGDKNKYIRIFHFWVVQKSGKFCRKQITIIPEKWMSKGSLLCIGYNPITEIPENWNPYVEEININNTQITSIPENWNIKAKYLFLNNNQITSIPENWNPNIRVLCIFGNPIPQIQIDKFKINHPHILVY